MKDIQFYSDEWEVSDALQAFYVPYASYVVQTRALPDARDGLKVGARYILYSQYIDKLTYKNKRRKAVATVNAAMRFSPHGDSSILGTAVRMSQDFSLRYPVIEVQGNNGSYICGDDYSQARYLEMRGNEIAYEMTHLLEKDTVDTWKMNYTNEEQYPTVLPSKFPYGLVNGSFGIGVACASAIPPHNISDVCTAAITLLNNPNASFEEIYCPIDFPTGGTIINEEAVKESLKRGCGKAALVRATIEYNQDANELVVKELPYMTFTSNIIKSISKALEEGLISGIENIVDGTDYNGPEIDIKLTKTANVKRVVKDLYKHTLLQNSFSINVNMLENGLKPKLYGWKEHLQTYLDHLKNIIVKAYTYDLNKLLARIHILDGLILASENIEKIVEIIKKSSSTSAAKASLIKLYQLDEVQAGAILKMRLSSLTNLEVNKLTDERKSKSAEAAKIQTILNSEENIKKEIEKDLKAISEKYGDAHRTKNINLDFNSEEDDAEPIEKKELLIHYTNLGNLYTQESSTLMKTKRGGKGSKVKMSPNEVILKSISDDNFSSLMVFSNKGQMYSMPIDDLPINAKINIKQLFEFAPDEVPTTITSLNRREPVKYFTFITKDGIIKKTKAEEYSNRRGKAIKAINLKDGDEVVNVLFTNSEKVSILTFNGNCVIINTEDINPIGRVATGVTAIKLNSGDHVVDATLVSPSDKFMITLSRGGLVKKTPLAEFETCSRATKGKKISGVKDGDNIVKHLTFTENCDIIILVNKKQLKISTEDLRELSRSAIGVKAVDLKDGSVATDLVKA